MVGGVLAGPCRSLHITLRRCAIHRTGSTRTLRNRSESRQDTPTDQVGPIPSTSRRTVPSDITTMYFHSGDNGTLASTTALTGAPPPPPSVTGARSPSWNGGLFESHYNLNPQLILINRYELVRMSQQVFATNPGNLGNTDTLTFGLRYYPFISSRAGFAYHAEYAISRIRGGSPVTFTDVTSSSLLGGIDFDF